MDLSKKDTEKEQRWCRLPNSIHFTVEPVDLMHQAFKGLEGPNTAGSYESVLK